MKQEFDFYLRLLLIRKKKEKTNKLYIGIF